ncbi:hypothetical protein V493_04489 [Pseudogymnoascus sp. VKM F-4281 (FW-2241)]|nr:hypothetical protein V493_04489 [Pseudogymnoascus sp. VKM F-4281 (FW-2241)]
MKFSISLIALLPIVIAAPVQQISGGALDNLGGIKNGVPLNGAKIPDVLNEGDVDSTFAKDVTVVVEPEADVLSPRDSDSVVVEVSGPNVVGDINKSIDTQLKVREPQYLTITADVAPASDLREIANDGQLSDKRELSPAELLANARKELSVAENNYRRYPNEVTKAAYADAVATLQPLLEPSN